MACFSPIHAWQQVDGKVVFKPGGHYARSLVLPCGQCIGCRLERSRQWAMRCLHEGQLNDSNCFITLTYDDDHLPQDGSLVYWHFQDFMKRLRKRVGTPIRFYMCGEYGEKYLRPHFHFLCFGWRPRDLVPFKKLASGFQLYTSAELSKSWTDGFSSVGELSFESAAYVARYVMKKVNGEDQSVYDRVIPETGEIVRVVPEFTRMSLKPGIGHGWFQKFSSDCYPSDRVAVNGRLVKPPKYYDRLFSEVNPLAWESIELDRRKMAIAMAPDCTYDRLRVRESVARARLSFKLRTLE